MAAALCVALLAGGVSAQEEIDALGTYTVEAKRRTNDGNREDPPFESTDYDALHYDIHVVDIDFVAEFISCDVSITVRSLVPDLSMLLVNLRQSMVVSSIEREGVPLEFAHENQLLHIVLDRIFGVDGLCPVSC
jgi:hypothetical protein